MQELGVTMKEISIVPSVTQHFKDIEHDINVQDATYENAQARERTQILMDLANEYNGLVIGTGDLSELALGWCTYNGDHMSMYAVNGSVPKTLVKQLVGYVANQTDNVKVAESLRDIVDTPISPELVPTNESGEVQQKTEDIVGPYELHDFFLYYFLRLASNRLKSIILQDKHLKENIQMKKSKNGSTPLCAASSIINSNAHASLKDQK